MNVIGEVLGRICAAALPISESIYEGDPGSAVAVCTLSDMDLLRRIAASGLMGRVRVAGRLLSENKGIDRLLEYCARSGIRTIIVCGTDAAGHRPGHSLFKLHANGTDPDGRISGSASPDPYLESAERVIGYFMGMELVDMTGETRLDRIAAAVSSRLPASLG